MGYAPQPGMGPAGPFDAPRKGSDPTWIILLVVLVPVGLTVVVTIIGILAAVAIPAFIGYIRRAKVSEAETNLVTLRALVESSCQATGALPPAAGPLPAVPAPTQQWASFEADPGFAPTGFAPTGPFYFSYQIEPEGPDTVRLVARGDLDGDGLQSERSYRCARATCSCDDVVTVRDGFE